MTRSAWSRKRLVRDVKRTISRFRYMRPVGLAGAIFRAGRLHFLSTRPPTASVRRDERVVITLTTIPARLKMLGPALNSLLDQSVPADRIMIALPHNSRRTGEPYPDPGELDLPPGVDVIRCDDDGPATKLLPALKLESDAVLVVVDDDVIYPRRFIETLLGAHRANPEAAVGLRGVKFVEGSPFAELEHVFSTGVSASRAVDVLFGTWGYLIPRGVLGEAAHDFRSAPPEVRWADDVWISGHLARAGVPRLVVASDQLPIETLASFRAALTDGINRSGENDRIAAELFKDDW